MKKLLIGFLALSLVLLSFVSCNSNAITLEDGVGTVSFEGVQAAATKALSSYTQHMGKTELYWRYTAEKKDNGFKQGQTTTPISVENSVPVVAGWGTKGLDALHTFSVGEWEFTLYAYKTPVDSTKYASDYVYTGKATAIVEASQEKTVKVGVSPVSTSGLNGSVDFSNVTVPGATGGEKRYKFAGDASWSKVNPRSVAPGTGKTAYVGYFTDSAASEPIVQSSILVTVYRGLTTYVCGTVDDQTGGVRFDADIPETVANCTVSNVTNNKYPATLVEVATAPDKTENNAKTSVSVPAGAVSSNIIGTVTNNQTVTTNVAVTSYPVAAAASKFTVSSDEVAIAGIDVSMTVSVDGGAAKAVSSFDLAVTVTTYIMKNLSSPKVMYGNDQITTGVVYTPSTGKLEFETNHFSEYYVTIDAAAYVVETNTAYDTLVSAVAAVEDGQTVKLLKSCSGSGIFVNPSTYSTDGITIDLGGFTYTCNSPVGSTDTENQALHLEQNNKITVKNGTITSLTGNKNFRIIIQNYCDLTLDSVTLDGTKLDYSIAEKQEYVFSNNCGTVTIKDSTITAKSGDFALDSCKYLSYNKPTVTLSGTSVINGKVEASGGDITFENGVVVNGQVRVGENKSGGSTGSTVAIKNGATVNNVGSYAVLAFGNNTIDIEGNVNGIVGTNGNSYNAGSTINVKDGAYIVGGGAGIYSPNGTLNISGGTITGETAVYFKSTNLNISGGVLIGTGACADYTPNGGGFNPTGDALVIDNYGSDYIEIGSISISGGTFESTNADAVGSYKNGTITAATGFITGGKFSSNPSVARSNNGDTVDCVKSGYTVSKEGNYYTVEGNWLSVADTSWYDGQSSQYTISTAEGLAGLAKLTNENGVYFDNKTVRLASDINLGGKLWVSIAGFDGIFDGQNHTISNMTINDMTSDYAGFFAKFGGANADNGIVKDVTFSNASVTGQRCGVVMEYTRNVYVRLDNVKVLNSVVNGVQKNGGLIGFASGPDNGGCTNVIITNCTVDGLSFGDAYGSWQCGAVIGYTCTRQNITVTGNTVKNISIADDPAKSSPGIEQYQSHEFIGSLNTFSSSGYTVTISGNTIETGNGFARGTTYTSYCGGHSNYADGNGATVIVDEVTVAPDNWSAHTEEVTVGNINITSAAQLAGFAAKVNAGNTYEGYTVTLGADVDLAAYCWTPIGTEDHPFKGKFDGNSKTISNMRINLPDTDYIGLFGCVFINGEVLTNVKIKNVDIKGRDCVAALVGSVGTYSPQVKDCDLTGSVKIEGNKYVGGLIGHGYSGLISECTVDGGSSSNSYIKGVYLNSSHPGATVGGIVAYSGEGTRNIAHTCTVKNITLSGTKKVGGIVGCLQTSNILGNNDVGKACNVENCIITSVGSDGYETENRSVGGIVGESLGGGNGGAYSYIYNCSIKNSTITGVNASRTDYIFVADPGCDRAKTTTGGCTHTNVTLTPEASN